MGTINVLEAIRRVDKKINIIFSSSAKAYGKMKSKPFLENDTLHGVYPDDVSKSVADLISQSYSNTYNLKIGIIGFLVDVWWVVLYCLSCCILSTRG